MHDVISKQKEEFRKTIKKAAHQFNLLVNSDRERKILSPMTSLWIIKVIIKNLSHGDL